MTKIQDGTGSGNWVRVGDSLKLDVSSRVNDRIYYASRDDGKAFTVQFELTQDTGGATEALGYLQYTGTGRLNIKQIALTSEEDGLTKFGIWKNPTVSGGDDATQINLNYGSNNTSNTTAKKAGSVLTITSGSSIYTVRMGVPDTKIVPFYDAIILGTNDIIAIKANAATTATALRANIMFAESIT